MNTKLNDQVRLNEQDGIRARERRGRAVFESAAVEPWPEAVEGGALLDEIGALLRRFVVLPAGAAEGLALWSLHTYAHPLREVTTYVGVESPEKRCGKTTLLEVLSLLVNRPVVASNISPAAIFRVIEEGQPTLIIDEADTFLRGNDEMRGILNAGYTRRTAYVVRVEGSIEEGQGRLAKYSCWCPKVLAAIGQLPDTLADRCIVVRMQRKLESEKCERLRGLDTWELRRRCVRWVLDHEEQIRAATPEVPGSLHDRAADIWEPLLALAELAGGEWPRKGREAAMRLSLAKDAHSVIGFLVQDITEIFRDRDRIRSRDLVWALNEQGFRPWTELSGGKPITELWLSRTLRPYGVRPSLMRVLGEHSRGYWRSDFDEMLHRYLSASVLGEDRGQDESFKAEEGNRKLNVAS